MVLTKTRRRILRRIFDQYLSYLTASRQHDKNEKSADFFLEQRSLKI